jgi:hypothetical protein
MTVTRSGDTERGKPSCRRPATERQRIGEVRAAAHTFRLVGVDTPGDETLLHE